MKKLLIGLLAIGSISSYASCFSFTRQFAYNGGAIVEMKSLLSGTSFLHTALISKDKNINSRFIVTQVISDKYNHCDFGTITADSGNKYCKFKKNIIIDSYQLLSMNNKCLMVTDRNDGSLLPIFEISGSDGNGSVLNKMVLRKMNYDIDSDVWEKIDSVTLD